jgi:hypothetical protein
MPVAVPPRADAPSLLPRVHERITELTAADDRALRGATARLAPDDAVEATALAAVATRRIRDVELHDAQLVAGLAMCLGSSVQMRTGEGKTFAAIAPALLFARTHGTVHVVTANPYLAERDSAWSGDVLRALGLTVGVTLPGRSRAEIRTAYLADVVFGAGSDFGFDRLRDRLVLPGDPPVQRGRRAAIVDEADAVLVDGARTPLVLSGRTPVDATAVRRADDVVRQVLPDPGAIDVDPLLGRIELTDRGIDLVEGRLGVGALFAGDQLSDWPHVVHNAVRAHVLLERDRDYVVRDDATLAVVDELTGRVLPGRRWSDGLHQAVEAKEGLALTQDRRALGRTTIGGYFSGYDVLVGMSGTLEGAEEELLAVYGITTTAVAPHRPVRRRDVDDLRAPDGATKEAAIADDVVERHRRGQPVLVGTVSIAQTQRMSELLETRRVAHQVLTARNDAEEAAVIAAAGRRGAVTVATQMAGRGVDIVLGPDVADGLMVWGVEHHPARRLDLQLRGRAGRQGDPGETRFAVADDEAATTQGELERLAAEGRRDGRVLDGPIDALEDLVHEWRRAASDPRACVEDLLPRAVRCMADEPLPIVLAVPGIGSSLPRTSGRRGRELTQRIEDRLTSRADPELWADIASAVLGQLLVTMWSETLEHLETAKSLARIGHLFGAHLRAWRVQTEQRYGRFRVIVQRAWVVHLLLAEIVVGDGSAPDIEHDGDTEVEQDENTEDEVDVEVEVDGRHEWSGFSMNAWWRRHCSLAPPDPELVLDLDAIGDAAPGTLRVHLDLDDPTRSRIVVPAGYRSRTASSP